MKPPKIIRPTKLTLALPEDIRAKLDLHLWSQVENRVPFGAYQRFFVERIQEFFRPRQIVDPKDRYMVHRLLSLAVEDTPQEWWVANFQNPAEAYNRAKDLIEELSK